MRCRMTADTSRFQRLMTWAVRLLAAGGALMVIVICTPLAGWIGHKMSGGFDDPQGDVLIVLGGAGVQDGIMGHDSYLRAEYAVRAWREGHFRQVFITGGGNCPAALGIRD